MFKIAFIVSLAIMYLDGTFFTSTAHTVLYIALTFVISNWLIPVVIGFLYVRYLQYKINR